MPSIRRRSLAAPAHPLLPRIIAVLAVTVAAIAALLVPTAAASAAEIPGAITSVTTDKASYGYNSRIGLTFDWSVPDSATTGDTFSLDLPDELQAVSQATFALRAADGSVIANAVWSGKSVVFALTDYVTTHDDVAGTGFVTVQWDHAFTPVTSQPITLQFDSNAVQVVIGDKPTPTPPCTTNCPAPPATPTARALSKSGSWSDGAFEGTKGSADNINWSIALPGNDTGFATPVQVVDTPVAGSVIDCGTISLTTQVGLAGTAAKAAVDPSRYSVVCSPSSFEIDLDQIAPAEFITIKYKGTITDQSSGAYANHVSVTIAGQTTIKDTTITRTAAGGVGGGVQSVAVGDFVWRDDNRDGIQDSSEPGIAGVSLKLTGPNGAPVTDIAGTPVAETVTDATGHYQFSGLPVLPAGQHYTVTIDSAASHVALAGLATTVAHAGSDAGKDSSTGSAESTDLTTNGARDESLDFGFVRIELPTLALPGTPDSAEKATRLAFTGVDGVVPTGLTALALVVLGIAVALVSRRRRVVR